MVTANGHTVSWLSPAPIWKDLGSLDQAPNRQELVRPAILRFANDGFMDELQSTLAYQPSSLGEWRVVPETWEKPMRSPPTAAKLPLAEPVSKLSVQLARRKDLQTPASTALVPVPPGESGDPSKPLKLFQAVQLRHYLVTASLVCQRPGLPDRRIDPGKQERVAYVMRRIVLPEGQDRPDTDPRTWEEYGLVIGPAGAHWQQVNTAGASAVRILPGEERLPLFSLGFDESPDRKRRLWGGVIPVGRREAYVAAPVQPAPSSADGTGATAAAPDLSAPATDPRRLLFQMQVTGPWSELVQQNLDQIERADRAAETPDPVIHEAFGDPSTPSPDDEPLKRPINQAQTISWYLLLDFQRFLLNHLPRLHHVLAGTSSRTTLDAETEEPLLAFLERFTLAPALQQDSQTSNLLQVLTLLVRDPSIGEGLEAVDVSYEGANSDDRWPKFLFPMASVLAPGPFPFSVAGADLSGHAAGRDLTLERMEDALGQLADLVERALPSADSVGPMPEIHIQAHPQFDTRVAWFAIRCVYERPNCGPFEPPVLSEPTQPFQLAGFFDSDAPVRPVRIPLPFDISPAGLRKFPKGATLMISDMLCGQLKKIRKLTLGDLVLSVLPWPFHKDLPNPGATGPCKDGDTFGMFCSLSIPIVTLCALILLLIIVALFDIFFKWLPLLFFCFPVKLLSGKRR